MKNEYFKDIKRNISNYKEKNILSYRQNNIILNNNYKKLFPKLSKSCSSKENSIKFDVNKIKNIKIKKELDNNIIYKNDKILKDINVNRSFFNIKRKMNLIFPRSKSSMNINNYNLIYKNVFYSESPQKIKEKIYNKELYLEYNNKKKKYELLLYSLIKKDKNPIENELKIKYNFINQVNEIFKKNNFIKLKLLNNEILNKFKKNNYANFKKNIFHSVKKKKEMENKIKILLDSAEAKFDEIFYSTIGKNHNIKV